MHGARCPATSFRAGERAEVRPKSAGRSAKNSPAAQFRRNGAPDSCRDPRCPYTSRPFLAGVSPVRPELEQVMYAVIATGGKQYRVSRRRRSFASRSSTPSRAPTVEFGEVLLIGEGDEHQGRRAAAQGRQGHRDGRAEPRQGRQGRHRQVPPPQALHARRARIASSSREVKITGISA